jgi:hypothetical protein
MHDARQGQAVWGWPIICNDPRQALAVPAAMRQGQQMLLAVGSTVGIQPNCNTGAQILLQQLLNYSAATVTLQVDVSAMRMIKWFMVAAQLHADHAVQDGYPTNKKVPLSGR